MLLHIFKSKVIQMLRRAGYSKKQSVAIYAKFQANTINQHGMRHILNFAYLMGMNHEVISSAFTWYDSPQGHDYWSNLNIKCGGRY